MKKSFLPLFCVLFLLVPFALAQDPSPKELDAYLAQPDSSYAWKILESNDEDGTKTFSVDLTSQTWHDIVWKHSLVIIDPEKNAVPDSCLLYISGGAIGKGANKKEVEMMKQLANRAGMTVAYLPQVPNQPLFGSHTEDSAIAETFLKTLATKDTTWPLLFPMAKSAIRAMDTTQAVLKEKEKRDVKNFVIAGGSKRGWTTWLAGASKDKRVLAIAPIVINTLNMAAQMPYQVETWGDYSEQIADYSKRGLLDDKDPAVSEMKKSLFAMVDPYSYRSRLTMPKLVVNGANDPYWTVDAIKFYWDDLIGPKYTITLPNAGHNLGDQAFKALGTLVAFARYACSGDAWPDMTWKRDVADDHYTVSVKSEIPAKNAKIWTAKSASKDFRKSKWESKSVSWKNGECKVDIPKPSAGHIAYYVELEFQTPQDFPASVTTQVWRDGE